MENKLKKIIKNNIRLLSFALVLLFLLLLSLQLTVIQISTAYAETLQKSSETYPDTPEGVVEAFVKAGLEGVPRLIGIGICFDVPEIQYKYLPDREDVRTNTSGKEFASGPLWDRFHIATGYEIKEVRKGKNKAAVKVLYKRLGWIWDTPVDIKECRSHTTKEKQETGTPRYMPKPAIELAYKEKGWVWDEKNCKFLHVTHDTQEVTYNLAKPRKFWRIIDAYEPYISVSSAIKVFECTMIENPFVGGRNYPSEKQKIEIKKDMDTLKNIIKMKKRG